MLGALLCFALAAADAGTPAPKVVAVKAARVFDGTGDKLIAPGLVIVSGGKITARPRIRARRIGSNIEAGFETLWFMAAPE